MRVVIAGAGSVGRSIANELLTNGHEVLVIDRCAKACAANLVPDADWLLADACELSSLVEADLENADVVVAATGDDKVNLVLSFLSKTEFGVPRTVARVNNPRNEWMFDDAWGVDVAVSTPRLMTALVEEAVTVGDLVQMFTFQAGGAMMVEFTIPLTSSLIGTTITAVAWPADTVPVGVIRAGRPLAPTSDVQLEAGDELLMLTTEDSEDQLKVLLQGT